MSDAKSMRIHANDTKIIYPELSYLVTGLCFEVQKELGRFCRERQYCDVLEYKFKARGINYEREKVVVAGEEGEFLGNRIDFVVDGKILLEIKSLPYTTKNDYFQVQRYLRATKLKLAMIINFRSKYLKPKRIINNLI